MTNCIESVSDGIQAEAFLVGYEISTESNLSCYQEEVLSCPQNQATNGFQRLVEEEVQYCAKMPHLQLIKQTQAALDLCKKYEDLIKNETDAYKASELLALLSEKIASYDPKKALELLEKCQVDFNKTKTYIEISKHQNIVDAETTLKKAREELTSLLVKDFDYINSWYFQHVQKLSLALYNEEKKRGFLDLKNSFAGFLKSFEKSPRHLEYPKSVNETLRVLLLMHQPSSIIKDLIIEKHDFFMKDFPKYPQLYARYLPTLAAIEGHAKLPQALETLETFWTNATDTYQCIQMLRVQTTEPYFSNTLEKSVLRILDLVENSDECYSDFDSSDLDYSMMFDTLLENNYLELAQRVLSSMTNEYDIFEAKIALYESQASQEEGFNVERALNSLIAQHEKLAVEDFGASCIKIFEFAAKYLGFPAAMGYTKYLEAAKENYMKTPWDFLQIWTILDTERKYNLTESEETFSFIQFVQKYGGNPEFIPLEFMISEAFSSLHSFA